MSNLIRKQHISLFKWNGLPRSRSASPLFPTCAGSNQRSINNKFTVYIQIVWSPLQYTNNVSGTVCNQIDLWNVYKFKVLRINAYLFGINLVKVCLIDRLISYSRKRYSRKLCRNWNQNTAPIDAGARTAQLKINWILFLPSQA